MVSKADAVVMTVVTFANSPLSRQVASSLRVRFYYPTLPNLAKHALASAMTRQRVPATLNAAPSLPRFSQGGQAPSIRSLRAFLDHVLETWRHLDGKPDDTQPLP